MVGDMRFVRFGSIQSKKWTVNYWGHYWQSRYNLKTKKRKRVKKIFWSWLPKVMINEYWELNFDVTFQWLCFWGYIQRYRWLSDNPRVKQLEKAGTI